MHSLVLSEKLVACRSQFCITDQSFAEQPVCHRLRLAQFHIPNWRNVDTAKKYRDTGFNASLVDVVYSRRKDYRQKIPSQSFGSATVRKCLKILRRDVQRYAQIRKHAVWDDENVSRNQGPAAAAEAEGEKEMLKTRNIEAAGAPAVLKTLQKLRTFRKLQTSTLSWFILAAVEFLNVSYAFGVDVNPEDCAGISRQNNTALIVVTCVVEAIALTGAAVGGILARQRKLELERINGQLRQIFAKMRRQYQVEAYAPSLTYAPAGITSRLPEAPSRADSRRAELMNHLKAGKRFLREQKPEQAFEEFEQALPIAKELKDVVEEKKAARGLGASCQRQGKFKEAIKYHSMVLTLSHLTGEHSGDTEALGAIADCYTELGDLETAGKYYDQYIARMDDE